MFVRLCAYALLVHRTFFHHYDSIERRTWLDDKSYHFFDLWRSRIVSVASKITEITTSRSKNFALITPAGTRNKKNANYSFLISGIFGSDFCHFFFLMNCHLKAHSAKHENRKWKRIVFLWIWGFPQCFPRIDKVYASIISVHYAYTPINQPHHSPSLFLSCKDIKQRIRVYQCGENGRERVAALGACKFSEKHPLSSSQLHSSTS